MISFWLLLTFPIFPVLEISILMTGYYQNLFQDFRIMLVSSEFNIEYVERDHLGHLNANRGSLKWIGETFATDRNIIVGLGPIWA